MGHGMGHGVANEMEVESESGTGAGKGMTAAKRTGRTAAKQHASAWVPA